MGIGKVGFGSYLAVPLTSGGGLLSGVKLKKEDQKLTLGSKVGLPLQSSYTPRRPQTPACSQDRTCVLLNQLPEPAQISNVWRA